MFGICKLPAHIIARMSYAIYGSFRMFSAIFEKGPSVAMIGFRNGLAIPLYEWKNVLSRASHKASAWLKT